MPAAVRVDAQSLILMYYKQRTVPLPAALAANSLIFVAKSAAWFVSGGSSLLAEAIHSLADIGNQAMLRVGITYAAQAPTAQYPFGHMRDKFIFRCGSASCLCMHSSP